MLISYLPTYIIIRNNENIEIEVTNNKKLDIIIVRYT